MRLNPDPNQHLRNGSSYVRNYPDKNYNITKTTEFKSYKQRKSFATRRSEVASIRAKFPSKIPVIVERYQKETTLPLLDKTKFLVPQELSMSQFVQIIRNRMQLSSTQAFYLLVGNRSLAAMSKTMLEIYNELKDPDGFLYVSYASQEVFG
ncbi:unnamed protein product [Darwinula stevensoni]|uniref:Uncharacterized protein n=1 Tax=Darwinula stevensoni TaxID=69355 RepID=A0A7R8WYG1_9CRUS|nr:unnamed protein product [Darwinula stevensoni]CAG0879356.1 unnamed protein product [Darwinula stevensoni]